MGKNKSLESKRQDLNKEAAKHDNSNMPEGHRVGVRFHRTKTDNVQIKPKVGGASLLRCPFIPARRDVQTFALLVRHSLGDGGYLLPFYLIYKTKPKNNHKTPSISIFVFFRVFRGKKTKRTQFSLFSTKKQGIPKKRTQNKPIFSVLGILRSWVLVPFYKTNPNSFFFNRKFIPKGSNLENRKSQNEPIFHKISIICEILCSWVLGFCLLSKTG
jgi:hypothetical protein